MSEYKVYNNKKNELVKQNKTKNMLNITKKFMITVAVVLFLNQAIAFITGYNLIWGGVKYILNAIDIYNEPVEKVYFKSDGWDKYEPGSWHITKSAHWTSANTAEVEFTLKTVEKITVLEEREVIPDVILVLDTSLSMEGNKLNKVKEHSKNFVSSYLTKYPEKTIAVVDFDDEGRIVLEFTSDIKKLQTAIDTLQPSGNTNYNDALKRVDDLMQIDDYAERSVSVLFLTDGVPCIDTPQEVATYKMLKEKYKFLAFNGIQYEMGTKITQEVKNISDYYKYATMDNLGDIFYELTQKTDVYEKFIVTDYIKDKYFYVNDESDINTYYCGGDSIGTTKIINESDGTQKVVWDLGNDYMTGTCDWSETKTVMTIKLTLKDEYVEYVEKDLYPTNISAEVNTKLEGESESTIKGNDTPVLERIYEVTYENNPPTDCKIDEIFATQNHYVYETVTLLDSNPTCPGYVFKGWQIVSDNVKPIGNNKFEMPTKRVTIRAKWSKQAISKSMNGTTGVKPTLFEIAQIDGQERNGATVYTGQVSDKFNANSASENATIYYYTSKISNNVVFANICWQMVRTTSTGGVKLLYNGPYDEKLKCSDSREGNYFQIDRVPYNQNYTSPADVGYMYNKRYQYGTDYITLDTALWAEDVSYSNGVYTLKNTKTGGSDTTHRYVCEDGAASCSKVRYYYYNNVTTFHYITLEGAANINEALDEMIGADDYNDKINNTVNTTSSNVKTIIDNWYKENIDSKTDTKGNKYSSYLEDVIYCNDRSILDYGGWRPGGALNSHLRYNNHSLKNTYECPRLIDQFSQSNPKAKLTYPVGLLTGPEANRMGGTFRAIGHTWWLITPTYYGVNSYAYERYIHTDGNMEYLSYLYEAASIRPAVSLKPNTKVSSGNGTMDDPYIIDKPAS